MIKILLSFILAIIISACAPNNKPNNVNSSVSASDCRIEMVAKSTKLEEVLLSSYRLKVCGMSEDQVVLAMTR